MRSKLKTCPPLQEHNKIRDNNGGDEDIMGFSPQTYNSHLQVSIKGLANFLVMKIKIIKPTLLSFFRIHRRDGSTEDTEIVNKFCLSIYFILFTIVVYVFRFVFRS